MANGKAHMTQFGHEPAGQRPHSERRGAAAGHRPKRRGWGLSARRWASGFVQALLLGLFLTAAAATAWAAPVTAAKAMAKMTRAMTPLAPCSLRYATVSRIVLPAGVAADVAIRAAFHPTRVWGLAENVRIVTAESSGGAVLAVRYPKGSIAPSSDAPRGGAGFVSRAGMAQAVEAACLSYRLRFASGFAFGRGGKLPGLYGGNGPVGGAVADAGFSARLMWRQNGDGELYAYLPDSTTRHGRSLGRGNWRFPSGRWVTVEEEIVLNDPDLANGIARIWIAGALRFEARGLVLRRDPAVQIEGLMFSTFFGGRDPSWASPQDQEALFADFALHLPASTGPGDALAALATPPPGGHPADG